MSDFFLSQFLVIIMLFCSCFRIFFTKNSKIDSAAFVSPAAFIVALLNFFIWRASVTTTGLLLLSLIVFITNVRSLFRLSAHLYIDNYSTAFTIFTHLELLIVVISGATLIYYRPVKTDPADFKAVKTVSRLYGSLDSGYKQMEQSDFKHTATGYLYTYEPAEKTDKNIVILFAGNARAEVSDYEPYLLFLAEKGYPVYAADFYDSQLYGIDDKYLSGPLFRKMIYPFLGKEINSTDVKKCFKTLTSLADRVFDKNTSYFYIFDGLDYDSIMEVTFADEERFNGFYSLTRIPEYKSTGYGFVEQTSVLTARKLGLSRDKTLFIPRYAAGKTVEEIQLLLPQNTVAPEEQAEKASL